MSNAPSNGLLGLGKLGIHFGIYAAGAVVSLTLYITMIPLMPAGKPWKGAVIGTIVGEAFLTIAGWVALRHCRQRHDATLDAPPSEPSPIHGPILDPPPPYVAVAGPPGLPHSGQMMRIRTARCIEPPGGARPSVHCCRHHRAGPAVGVLVGQRERR